MQKTETIWRQWREHRQCRVYYERAENAEKALNQEIEKTCTKERQSEEWGENAKWKRIKRKKKECRKEKIRRKNMGKKDCKKSEETGEKAVHGDNHEREQRTQKSKSIWRGRREHRKCKD